MTLSPNSTYQRWTLWLACILGLVALIAYAQDAQDPAQPAGPPTLAAALAAYQGLDDPSDSPEAARLFQLLRIHGDQAVMQADYSEACDYYRQAFDVAVAGLSAADMSIVLQRLRQLEQLRIRQERVKTLIAELDARRDPPTVTDIERLLRETGDVAYVRSYLAGQADLSDVRLQALAAPGVPTDLSPADIWKIINWLDGLAAESSADSVTLSLHKELTRYCLAYLQGIDETHPNYARAEAITLAAFRSSTQEQSLSAASGTYLAKGVWLNLLDIPPSGLPNMASWQVEGTSLLSAGSGNTAGYLPIDFTDAEYELRLCLNRRSTRGRLTIFFPMGDQLGRLLLSGTRAGDRLNNEGMQPSLLAEESFHVIAIKVFRDETQAYQCEFWADGQLAAAGPLARDEVLSMSPAHREEATGRISFNAAGGEFEIFAIDLMLNAGQALPTSSDDTARTTQTGMSRKTITVHANRPWQWAMEVKPGQVLDISATGLWSPEPELQVGPAGDDFGWYALRGRLVESDRPFEIGNHAVVIVTRPDILKLEMDDPDKGNNSGRISVTVTTYALPTPAEPQPDTEDE